MTSFSDDGFPADGQATGILTIDLDALTANYRALADKAAGDTAAVVKADAYGLGLEPVARTLAEAGCTVFFVATPDEGISLRELLPHSTIYVLDGLLPGLAGIYADHRLQPCLSGVEEVLEWTAFCKEHAPLPAALHIDTGMNRLGLQLSDLPLIGPHLAQTDLTLLMSHLACADEPEHPLNAAQLAAFVSLKNQFPGVPMSLANTAGVLLGAEYHLDLVRPGIGLYGVNPYPEPRNPFQPVVSLAARVLRVGDIPAGVSVGYGATFEAPRATRLATLSAGYADGIGFYSKDDAAPPRRVVINGYSAPIVGRISMDLLTADVTDLPATAVKRGDFAEIIGETATVGEIARAQGTIGYEVLTRLGYRYSRRYTSKAGINAPG